MFRPLFFFYYKINLNEKTSNEPCYAVPGIFFYLLPIVILPGN